MLLKGGVTWANVDIWNHQNKHAHTTKGSRPYFDSSTPHIHMATISSVKQSKTHYNQWYCLHRRRRQIPDSKLLPRSIYDIFTQISNDFQRSLCRFRCRHGVSLLLFCKPSVHWWALSSASWVDTRLLQGYCWLATSLFWYSAPTHFLKRLWKNAYPTFKLRCFWEIDHNIKISHTIVFTNFLGLRCFWEMQPSSVHRVNFMAALN